MPAIVAVERAYSAIARFYSNCKKAIPGKKGYPTFKKNCRSVEYKTSGWSLSQTRKQITFTDKKGIGRLKLKGTWDLNYYQLEQIKRVRLVRRADGYYVQFLVHADNKVDTELTGKMVGLDVGLKEFYVDSIGHALTESEILSSRREASEVLSASCFSQEKRLIQSEKSH